jgi:1-deoxy-D-xylulose-5-phosphate synthase
MAARGLLPFCNIYSSFMQRAYDQVIHDVALQGLNVVFCLDRGGLVGEDGPTHHGVFDLAYFRAIPGLIISSPMNEVELRNLMYTAQLPDKGPFVIRYPRGRGLNTDWKKPFEVIQVGTARKIREGRDVAILCIGHPGNFAAEASEQLLKHGIEAAVYDMRFLKPLDETMLHEVCRSYPRLLTVEDGTILGGLGSAVLEFMADHGYNLPLVRLGVPDRYITQGKPEELYAECGYDTAGIVAAVKDLCGLA